MIVYLAITQRNPVIYAVGQVKVAVCSYAKQIEYGRRYGNAYSAVSDIWLRIS